MWSLVLAFVTCLANAAIPAGRSRGSLRVGVSNLHARLLAAGVEKGDRITKIALPPVPKVDREGARVLAQEHLGKTYQPAGIGQILDASEVDLSGVYRTDDSLGFDNCWVAFVDTSGLALRSSVVVIVHKETGEVFGQYSLDDEG
jgi:hypothetical protein